MHLKDIYSKITENAQELEVLFKVDELDISADIPKCNRMYAIISKANNNKINRNDLILKFKNRLDPEIQFFIKKEHTILKVYLIDLYYLMILDGLTLSVTEINAMKDNKHCISSIERAV